MATTKGKTQDANDALQQGVFLHLSHGIFGIRRKVSTEKIDVKEEKQGAVDKKQLNVTKATIDCEEYRLICRAIEDSKSYLREKAIHLPYYREGFYFVPFERGEEIMKGIKAWQEKIAKLADDFAFKAYPKAKREAKAKLAHLYNEADYPSERYVRDSIYMDLEFRDETVPQRLRKLGEGLLAAEMKKAQSKVQSLVEQMQYAMAKELQELIGHLADRLSPDAAGDRKVFRESAITNVTEWLEYFDSKNSVVGSSRLKELADTLKKQLTGVDVKQLKNDDAFRKQLEKDMGQVKQSLDAMLKAAPKRLIAARDEEV